MASSESAGKRAQVVDIRLMQCTAQREASQQLLSSQLEQHGLLQPSHHGSHSYLGSSCTSVVSSQGYGA